MTKNKLLTSEYPERGACCGKCISDMIVEK